MRTIGKQHHSWKLDDERRRRPVTSSIQISPLTTFNSMPENYTPEQFDAGTSYEHISLILSCD